MCIYLIHAYKNKSVKLLNAVTHARKEEYACNNVPLHNHNTGEKIQWCSETGRPINYSFRLKCLIISIDLSAAFDLAKKSYMNKTNKRHLKYPAPIKDIGPMSVKVHLNYPDDVKSGQCSGSEIWLKTFCNSLEKLLQLLLGSGIHKGTQKATVSVQWCVCLTWLLLRASNSSFPVALCCFNLFWLSFSRKHTSHL